MHKYLSDYPLAPEGLESEAKKFFPYRTLSPEEYAAKEGERWACFSFGEYRYRDPALNRWIHTLDDIVFVPERLKAARQEHASSLEPVTMEDRVG